MAKRSMQANSFAFFDFLQEFYLNNKGRIRNRYKDLTKKFLDYNDSEKNPHAYLRRPQFEAVEMYVFLKEFCGNPQIYDLFDKWFKREGDFADETVYTVSKAGSGQMSLYDVAAVDYKGVFNAMRENATVYPNYIYALTMGLGKTVLMATCVFYEFLLANKYPNDKRFCHNVLVFAPDKTVLQSLHEIVTMKKELVVPQEYCRVLDQNIKFHFLDDAGITLNTLDNSDFNIIISNTQKIIKKRVHKEKTPIEKLLEMSNAPQQETDIISAALGAVYTEEEIRAIAAVCERAGIYVLSDEIYEKLTYDADKPHVSIASLSDEINEHVITVNGFSKTYAMTGWRLGYLRASRWLARRIIAFQSHATSNATTFAQYGAIAALEGKADKEVAHMCAEFAKRRDLVYNLVSAIPGVKCIRPQGAFYLLCDVSSFGMTSEEFCKRLLAEEKLAVIPCCSFGAEGQIRLSYACSEENIREAARRLEIFCREHCS